MDHVECSTFEDARSPKPIGREHFLDILTDIMGDTYKEPITKIRESKAKETKNKYKKLLLSFTPCGSFSYRAIKSVIKYNSVVILDIDGLDISKVKFLKAVLSRDGYVAAVFISPSGNGLKVFVNVDNEDPHKHKVCFEYCKDYIEGHYSNIVKFTVDVSGKDISRLCFVSWDPEAYYNGSASVMEVDMTYADAIEEFEDVATREQAYNPNYVVDAQKTFETMVKFVKASKTGHFSKGNRNTYVYVLSRLCSEYGIPYDLAFSYIGDKYPSLGFEEIQTTVKSAYKGGTRNFGTKQLDGQGGNKNQQSIL
jgi:hypothetical protein